VVGFSLGKVVEGITDIEAPDDCPNVPEVSKAAAKLMTLLITETGLPVYQKEGHHGVWRLFIVRLSGQTKEILLKLQIDHSTLSDEKRKTVKEEVVKFFVKHMVEDVSWSIKYDGFQLKSIFFQEYSGISNSAPSSCPDELLWGQSFLTETLCGLKFRVSPNAFFQVNTPAAEVLYGIVGKWGVTSSATIVFDICCGTGTIGLTLANRVKQVIGLEMEPSAVLDAEQNAQLNGVTNATYICGKAEDTLKEALKCHVKDSDDILAIVDPPRAGLHNETIRLIRNCNAIKRLVYVSCNPESLAQNLHRLLSPPTKRFKHAPFKAVKATLVDLFPHTSHCEMIVLLDRSVK